MKAKIDNKIYDITVVDDKYNVEENLIEVSFMKTYENGYTRKCMCIINTKDIIKDKPKRRKMRPIEIVKCGDDYEYRVINKEECTWYGVNISLIYEYNPLGLKTQKKYRVHNDRQTIATYLTLTEAKQVATRELKQYR